MDVVYTEEPYFESLGKALVDVEAIEPDRGQDAEERIIEIFDELSLGEFWDYSKEWHSEPNCCVIVFQNIVRLTEETLSRLSAVSGEFPDVIIHFIISDAIKGKLMVGPKMIGQLYFYNSHIPVVFIKDSDHSISKKVIAWADQMS